MQAAVSVDHLHVQPHPVPGPAGAALDQVARVERATDLLQIARCLAKHERGVARDHREPAERGQARGQVFDETVREDVLVGLVRKVVERKHGDRGSSAEARHRPRARLGPGQTRFAQHHRRLGAIADVERRDDGGHVRLDRRPRDPEHGCDLGIGETAGHQLQHLELPGRERYVAATPIQPNLLARVFGA